MIRRVALAACLAATLAPLAAADPPEPPSVTVPADVTAEAQSSAGAVVAYTASATDFRGRPIAVDCNPPSLSIFPLGPTVVTCSATDRGQTDAKAFTITVLDRTAPALIVPPDKNVRTRSRRGISVQYSALATDRVDGIVPATCTPASGSLFPGGTTTVSCRAEDRHGNVATGGFRVTVSILRAVRRTVLVSPRPGALISGPTILAWRTVPRARFYNVQLYRNGRKILTRWPTRPRFALRRSWEHEGRTFRLRRGVYTWLVWPAFGTMAAPRYGKLLGRSAFRVV